MAKSKIEWTDRTWNPVTGCSPVSEGCDNCYAERMSKRLAGRCGYPKDEPFKVTLHPDRLEQPLRWTKPSKVFVCSMADLFHEDVPFDFMLKLWLVMKKCPQHTFLILTKRPERMKVFINDWLPGAWGLATTSLVRLEKPLPNIWLGVTAENQKRADERIPILLQMPAEKRFVSVEPMLGPVDLTSIVFDKWTKMNVLEGCGISKRPGIGGQSLPNAFCRPLDWVICGGESGPGARPMRPDWARDLRDQCQILGVPVMFKQWGEWVSPSQMPDKTYREIEDFGDGIGISDNPRKVGKKRAGRLLDGVEWDEFPGGHR